MDRGKGLSEEDFDARKRPRCRTGERIRRNLGKKLKLKI